MLTCILVGNTETDRLEAEIRNENYDLVAMAYQHEAGFHVKQYSSEPLTAELLEKVREELRTRSDERSSPDGLSKGQRSLKLLGDHES